ncbi:transcriptional regulator, AraC family protein [Fulvimarina pelagi HTCC2506]|uniref:Transcriptional regulator, AraC family protein n=2 Tax=Fulvimarina pelagi TaxID=217511 RepID=Q0FYH5_9HYPH|nr:helix-turn-helix domain-containing protein [Fulvimarina pelagi]EAU40020.1 transcriptional regulator, AraC family protein [Fulvimarina pelagi HTCC2506]BAT31061.1 transcriptional regulator, AraC family protein [Fulvimarina pelagi]
MTIYHQAGIQNEAILRFCSTDYRPDDAAEAYRSLYAGGSDVRIADRAFSARFEARTVGPIVIFDRWLSGVSHERSTQKIRTDGFEHFVLQANLGGELVVTTPDATKIIRPGEIALLDAARPYVNRCDAAHIVTMSVARHVIENAIGDGLDLHGRILGSATAALLLDFMVSVHRNANKLSLDAAPALIDALSSLLSIAASPNSSAASFSDVSPDKLVAAKRIVRANLGDRRLDPEKIAIMAGVSRSKLYQLFKPSGGVDAYLQAQRVRRLKHLLSRPRETRGIAELVYLCGFASESHASRMFKTMFGMPPGEYRKTQRFDGSVTIPRDRLSDDPIYTWISALNFG